MLQDDRDKYVAFFESFGRTLKYGITVNGALTRKRFRPFDVLFFNRKETCDT